MKTCVLTGSRNLPKSILKRRLYPKQQVMEMTEGMLKSVWRKTLDVDLGEFPVLSWDDAMRDFGIDRPDLRNPLRLVDIADLMKAVDFKVFNGPANDPQKDVSLRCERRTLRRYRVK